MTLAETERLRLRNWEDRDRDVFFDLVADPAITRYLLPCTSREEADERFARMRDQIRESGYGFYALALKDCDSAIGWCGIAPTDLEPYLPAGTVEIGWRLLVACQGQGYMTEAAKACLRMGFERFSLEEIVAFTVTGNRRSEAVMQRIGMQRDPQADFDHPRVPVSRPDLNPHCVYRLSKEIHESHLLDA
ncbi:GNAT family N-acetyltransferase [Ruficoccus sp. ZRK36]|uniref:GNAT family N-acetyltransferase n=1 Tax=Ruficoccus sp. ZRK36 TaxID=2866311 RepID=UPI001C73657B|nr:GNAT family N-acetyltransferase [Ruficoccus sp. ZRK36]QYY37185.1 GNAT family N-acetyltransferase [Ruficoccus sp. ZRK36]